MGMCRDSSKKASYEFLRRTRTIIIPADRVRIRADIEAFECEYHLNDLKYGVDYACKPPSEQPDRGLEVAAYGLGVV